MCGKFWVLTLGLIVFSLHPCVAAQTSIDFLSPKEGALSHNFVRIQLRVTSTTAITEVTAKCEDRQTNLVFSSDLGWTQYLSLNGFERGIHALLITIRDVSGATVQTQRTFMVDVPPTLRIISPVDGTVVHSNVVIQAVAGDDDPAGLVIRVSNGNVLLEGNTNVNGVISLSGPYLDIQATDSAGQTVRAEPLIYFETNSSLREVITVPGPVLDFDLERVLFRQPPELNGTYSGVGFYERNHGEPRLLDLRTWEMRQPTPFPNPSLDFGKLTPAGAVLGYPVLAQPYPIPTLIRIWPTADDDAADLAFVFDLKVVAGVMAYRADGPLNLVVRDFAGTFSFSIPNVGTFDLASNFDLVYSASNQIYRSRPESPENPISPLNATQVTSGEPAHSPRTDGINVIFRRGLSAVLLTPHGEELLSTYSVSEAVNNGWTAFTKCASTPAFIWTRDPAGVLVQRTFETSLSSLESLGPNGELSYLTPGGRYFSVPGTLPWRISSSEGRLEWKQGRPYLIIGRSIFEFSVGNISAKHLPEGHIHLQYTGPAGLDARLLQSSDFTQWSEVSFFTNTTGVTSWTNVPATSLQFYRVVPSYERNQTSR